MERLDSTDEELAILAAAAMRGEIWLMRTLQTGQFVRAGTEDFVDDADPFIAAAHQEDLAIARAGEAPFQIVVAMGWLGYAYALLGRADEGIVLLEQSIAQAEAIEFIGGMAAIITLQSDAYLRAGRGNEARAAAHRGLELCRRLRRRGSEAETLHVLGEIAATVAPLDADAAEAHYRDAMALAEERNMRPLVAHCHLGLGRLYRRTGEREQTREHLTTAATMYREMGMIYWLELAERELRESG